MESFWQDIRFAVRTLRKSPGFTIVAVLVLAIGIGGNTAIYSLVDAMFVRGLPYPDSDRLMVLIGNVERASGVERRGGSYPDFADWRAQSKSFDAMAVYAANTTTLTAGTEPERVSLEAVSAPYFGVLGQTMPVGRDFRPDEDEVPGRNLVVILGDGLWKRRFGADPNVTTQTVLLGSRSYQVIGVAPPGFRGLSDQAELFLPYMASGAGVTNRGSRGFNVIARLKSGVTPEHAQAEMNAISKQLAATYPDTNDKRAVEISPLSVETFGQFQPVLSTLMIAVGFVLLIACLNVANLLISRSEARQREIAVRSALGAGQARLVRQLVTESCVLALVGAAAGLALTELAIRGLVAASPIALPSFSQPTINLPVLLFTMASALVCGVLLGLAPVMHTRIARLAEALKSSRGSSGVRTQRTRATLVVVEVALAVVLLIGAGLMIRSVQKLAALKPGFNPTGVLSLTVNIPPVPQPPVPAAAPGTGTTQPAAPQGPPPLVVSSADLLDRIRAVHGVVDASLVTDVPLAGNDSAVFYTAEGDATADAKTVPRAYVHGVWPGFFKTMGISLKSGRDFATADQIAGANTVIVSENVARRFWPGENAVGRRIKQGTQASTTPWLTIVGIVDEVKYRGLPENPTADPDLYFPFFDRRPGQSLVIRANVPPLDLAGPVRETIRALNPRIVVYNVAAMDTLISAQTAPSTFTTWLLAIFAGISLVLSVVGIYGVMSYLVAQRGREFGIRLALGARRSEIIGLVVKSGARLVIIGAVIGMAASFLATRVLGTLLFQVTTIDLASFAAVAVILIVAIGACCVPAMRASRLDPIKSLRVE